MQDCGSYKMKEDDGLDMSAAGCCTLDETSTRGCPEVHRPHGAPVCYG